MTSHVQVDTPHAGRPGGCVSKERKELILMHGYSYTATHLALHLPPRSPEMMYVQYAGEGLIFPCEVGNM